MRGLPISVYSPLAAGKELRADDLMFWFNSLSLTESAFGNYWRLSGKIGGGPSVVDEWIVDGVGRHIEVYSPGMSLIWEGFVNTVSANVGTLQIRRGPYMDIANKVRVIYSTIDTSTDPPTAGVREETAWYNYLDSQDRYGILEQTISLGGANGTLAAQVAQAKVFELGEPKTDEQDTIGGLGSPRSFVNIECLGYIHYLDRYSYYENTSGTWGPDEKIADIMAEDPNSIISTSTAQLDDPGHDVGRQEIDTRTALTILKGIISLGDSSNNRWLFWFGPGLVPHFHVAPTSSIYERRLSSPSQGVELSASRGTVEPWDIQPGEWLFYTDLLAGRSQPRSVVSSLRADPRYMFIEERTYTIPWQTTIRGSQFARTDQLLARMGLGGSAS